MPGLIALFVASGAGGQAVTSDVASAAQIAAALRSLERTTISPWSSLRQINRAHSAARLDSIADSVVAYILDYRPEGPIPLTRARGVLSQFNLAGSSLAEIPYAGSAARLLRIAESAAEAGLRAGAVRGLSINHNPVLARRFLVRLAISEGDVAEWAVMHLGLSMGPEGLADLETLYRAGTVRQSNARRNLEAEAERRGWRKDPR
jgi:hypothetical protein